MKYFFEKEYCWVCNNASECIERVIVQLIKHPIIIAFSLYVQYNWILTKKTALDYLNADAYFIHICCRFYNWHTYIQSNIIKTQA